MAIKTLHRIEQPREKLIKYGAERLNDFELLAILIRTGTKDRNVLEVAKAFIRQIGFQKLSDVGYDELISVKGIGPTKACEICAAVEIGRRVLKAKKTFLVLKPVDIWNELKDLRDNKKEHFIVFFLDTRNQEIKREIISIGSLNASLVHPREVFELAVKHLAAQVIVAHNHPSGNSSPSDADLKLTKQIVDAGRILGIEVID